MSLFKRHLILNCGKKTIWRNIWEDREMREHIFKLLFLNEFNGSEEMPQQIQLYFNSWRFKSHGTDVYGK